MQWQIKVHSFSTFRILRDTNCIEYGPVWYCLVENDCAFLVAIFGFNYRTLPEVFWQWRRWSVDHKPRWRKGSPEWVFETQIFPNQCWKGVNWWGRNLIAIVQCDSKKEVLVDLVHKFWPFMEVHFQNFGPHRCFSERHVTMIQPWISQYGNIGTGMLG